MLVKIFTALLLMLLISLNLYPQSPEHIQKVVVEKPGWLIDEWNGNAWTRFSCDIENGGTIPESNT